MEDAIKNNLNLVSQDTPDASSEVLEHAEAKKNESQTLENLHRSSIESLITEIKDADIHFKNGFWNGLYEVYKSNYDGYLTEKSQKELIEEAITENQNVVEKLEAEKKTHEAFYMPLFRDLKVLQRSLIYKIKVQERREDDLNGVVKDIQRYKGEFENLRNEYSFLAGVMFLLAGFAFILGDLVISHEVVAYALNIRNNVEAWSFAVGLAMVSILLKPAYDRLIEQPYIKAKSIWAKRIYLVFKILVVAFIIYTLFVLGMFRYEAYKTDKIKETLNQNIVLLQTDDESTNTAELERQTKEVSRLNQTLVSNPSGMYSFVLSGIMFAIAGAVCLGISFPILVAYTRIWFQIPMKIKKLEKEKILRLQRLEAVEQEVSSELAMEEIKNEELLKLGNLNDIKEQQEEVLFKIQQQKEELRQKIVETQTYQTILGFEKGHLITKLQKQEEEKKKAKEQYEKQQKQDLEDTQKANLAKKERQQAGEKNNSKLQEKENITEEKVQKIPQNASQDVQDVGISESLESLEDIEASENQENTETPENTNTSQSRLPRSIKEKMRKFV